MHHAKRLSDHLRGIAALHHALHAQLWAKPRPQTLKAVDSQKLCSNTRAVQGFQGQHLRASLRSRLSARLLNKKSPRAKPKIV